MKFIPARLQRTALALIVLGALVLGAAAHTSNAEAFRGQGDFCVWMCDPR